MHLRVEFKLDYYATHRMTSDSHTRIRKDGTVEAVPALLEMFVGSEDPEENAKLRAAFFEKNGRIVELLEAKGFGLSGDEPLSNQIRRIQVTEDRSGGKSNDRRENEE